MSDTLNRWQQRLQQKLELRHQQHLYRQRLVLTESPQPGRLIARGTGVKTQELVDFASNDYLALSNHPYVVECTQQAISKYGVGAGASHLVCGHNEEHYLLEQELASFTQRPRAVLFSSGYMANLGVMSALLTPQDSIYEDRLNHASLLDGGLLSGARFKRFLHSNSDHLAARIQRDNKHRNKEGNILIAVDGVFSMDGDMAPLAELSAVAQQHQAWLMVDDAHGFGYLGCSGAGVIEHQHIDSSAVPIYMATLGKALGVYGAFVAGSELLIENIIQFSRNYIYTTALPPAIAAGCRASLRLLSEEAWRREQLHQNIAFFRDYYAQQAAQQLGSKSISLQHSITAIQVLVVGDSQLSVELASNLQRAGFLVGAIRPPTVPRGSARLRITLCSAHSKEDIVALIDRLISELKAINKPSRVDNMHKADNE